MSSEATDETPPPPDALDVQKLYRRIDPAVFDFETTDELTDVEYTVGQDRLVSSVRFGMGMKGPGYNIFALGPRSTDKRSLVEAHLHSGSEDEPVPPDLCYVHNFEDPYRPRLLRLPAGMGTELSQAMEQLTGDLEPSLIAAFESEEYQNRRRAVEEAAQEEHGKGFEELQERARSKGLALLRTPAGFGFIPLRDDGEVMEEDDIKALTEEDREEFEERSEDLQEELQALLRTVPARKRDVRNRIKKLDREIADFAIRELVEGTRSRFQGQESVLEFLDQVQADVVANVQAILGAAGQAGGQEENPFAQTQALDPDTSGGGSENPLLARYRINLLVDHAATEGAPVVYEEHPTYKNLIGRIEYRSRMGALSTNFSLIRPGAIHRANGGYLVLDARSLLMEPFAWEALKRVLNTERLKIESLGQSYSMLSTVSLEPEPLELDVKVVLVGERRIYYLLSAYDPDFPSLFKVEADFEDEMSRDGDTDLKYARFLTGLIRGRELRPFHRDAVARVIEQGARLAGDREKISTRTLEVEDLLQQADHWAGEADRSVVSPDDVQKAIDQQIYRASRVRDRIQEQIHRDTLFIDTEGEAVGQINGLSVLQLGSLSFGRPTRITARVGLGKGEIVDIEREVEMGGPLHSKGILILKGFLSQRYARRLPLSLRASLVFEQSYGGVDGDSASAAELFALLSAIGRIPLKQSLAVTGSVNQHGYIQPIGGVNEKIEGFFDVCNDRGLNGEQGVVIPRSNVKNLMLRPDVVAAVEEDRFQVYSVETVDQALHLFAGIPAGGPDEAGHYPAGSFNAAVESELTHMAERLRSFVQSENGAVSGESGGEAGHG
jgi:lon-related putative ATP-dependent protease